MFSLKGRFSEDISSGAGDPVSRAIFHSGRAPTQRADVADHFIKLLYYSSGPCGGPQVLPFSRPFFTATYVDEGLALSRVYGPSPRAFPSLFIAAKKFHRWKEEEGNVDWFFPYLCHRNDVQIYISSQLENSESFLFLVIC